MAVLTAHYSLRSLSENKTCYGLPEDFQIAAHVTNGYRSVYSINFALSAGTVAISSRNFGCTNMNPYDYQLLVFSNMENW
jgi:hypothetical protein